LEDIMAPATAVSPQALIAAARAPVEGYNEKDWKQVKASITPDFRYEEMATARKATGADATIELWKGWGDALPDSRAEFRDAYVADHGTVVLEMTWKGTHRGPLQTPAGPIAATGRQIDVPACMIVGVEDGKARSTRHYFDMATLLRQLGVIG
jgi:steroid delta-isomerase-like uncharacterized protein